VVLPRREGGTMGTTPKIQDYAAIRDG
jgi:hypothetical protein